MAQPTRIIVLQRPDQPLEMLCARLRDWGCELALCDSYERAAAALAAEGADIVLIDAWVQDGLALLTRVKASPATRYLPIVIATANEPGAIVAHALALGADDVFVLPIADGSCRRAPARSPASRRSRSNGGGAMPCSPPSAWHVRRKRPACPRSTGSASC
jgi:CheY-like chemotaxis protein